MERRTEAVGAAVIGVLQDLTGADHVTPADDFYLIGGHSLLILRVIRKLRRDHRLELDPRQFAANPQVAALIAACRPAAADADQGLDD